jgi:TPR repeat protein
MHRGGRAQARVSGTWGEHGSVRVAYGKRHSFGVFTALLVALTLAVTPARADFAAGQAAYDAGNYVKAYAEWPPIAQDGDARAQYWLGRLFLHGYMFEGRYLTEGRRLDPAEATRWYLKAADQGETRAQTEFAGMYETGFGVEQDDVEAARWYGKAGDRGNRGAQFVLGGIYEKGKGVTQGYAEAARWYRLAADQGDGNAQRRVVWLERRMRLTEGLVEIDVVAPIVNRGVILRELPQRGAVAVRFSFPVGHQVHITGLLPTGWLQITDEGEAVGYIYKTAVPPDALAGTKQR